MKPWIASLAFLVVWLPRFQAQMPLEEVIQDGSNLAKMHLTLWYALNSRVNEDSTHFEEILVLSRPEGMRVLFLEYQLGQDMVVLEYWMDAQASAGSGGLRKVQRALDQTVEKPLMEIQSKADAQFMKKVGQIDNQEGFKRYRMVLPQTDGSFRVYYYCVSTSNEEIVFGYDQLITVNAKGKVGKMRHLHRNLQAVPVQETVTQTAHVHGKKEHKGITATDYAILELYGKLTPWKMHYVVGKKMVDSFNLLDLEIVRMNRKTWDQNQKQ